MIGFPIQPLKRIIASLLLASTFVLPTSGAACGLHWNEPQSHFAGVSDQGYVFLVERLGEANGGSGLTLPLFAIFRSESVAESPYAGSGWFIPLLESHIVQLDERWFRVVQPTGWYRLFWRDDKNPNLLHGQNGWEAEIKGNRTVAWADCGDKLVFQKNRIVSMQLKNRKFDYVYEGEQVSQIREGSTTVLTVETKPLTGEVTGIDLGNNHRIKLECDERPRVRMIDSQPLLVGTMQSLGKITTVNGEVRTIQYGVDEKLNPTVKIDNRLVTWNPSTKRMISDGEWHYQIDPGPNAFDYAAITRKNPDGKSEFWHNDLSKGREVVQGLDGIRKVTTVFLQGKLAGKIRELESIDTTFQKKTSKRYSYNEEGRLIRITEVTGKAMHILYRASYNESGLPVTKQYADEDPLIFKYNENKDVIEVTRNGTAVYQKSYDPETNSVIEKFENRITRTRRDLGNGTFSETVLLSDGTKREHIYQNDE